MSTFTTIKQFFGFEEENPTQNTTTSPTPPTKDYSPPIKGFKTISNTSSFNASEIKVIEPRIYEDSLDISTHLRELKPVIVNLKYLDGTTSKRLIDFVCGTAYAINGHMMKIGENIFLFTPSSIQISNNEEKSTFEKGVAEDEQKVFFKQVNG